MAKAEDRRLNDGADVHQTEEGRAQQFLSRQEQSDLFVSRRMLEILKVDLPLMKSGNFSALGPDSFARSLLEDRPDRIFNKLLKEMIRNKYHTANETRAQIVQRFGQSFHLVICGPTGAIVFSKVITAAMGGSAKIPTKTLIALLTLSLAQGWVGAISQFASINIKNLRRSQENGTSLSQFLQSVMAAPRVVIAHRRANQAVDAANAAQDDGEMVLLLVEYFIAHADASAAMPIITTH